MPTAAKLIAAMTLALAAFGASGVLSHRHEIFQTQGLNEIMFLGVGFIIGWWRLGPQAERGYKSGWSGGIAASLTTYLVIVVLATCAYILKGMERHHYRNIDDLMNATFTKSLEYAMFLFDGPVLIATVFGGLLAGTFAAMAGRVWT